MKKKLFFLDKFEWIFKFNFKVKIINHDEDVPLLRLRPQLHANQASPYKANHLMAQLFYSKIFSQIVRLSIHPQERVLKNINCSNKQYLK